MPSPLKLFVAALGSFVLIVGLVPAASAAQARPASPYVTAATLHTITLKWPKVSKAKRYTLHYSTSPGRATKKSARVKASKGRRTTLKVTGLGRGRQYCFAIRAIRGGKAGPRSLPVCGHTLKRKVRTKRPHVSVATFNVCAFADNCRRWTKKRENAVVRRIVEAKADVVAVQEVTRQADRLARRLEKYGYAHYTHRKRKRDEAIYYKTAKLEMDLEQRTATICEIEPYGGDTTTWRFPRHFDAPTQQWYAHGPTGWFTEQEVCRQRTARVEREGRIGSPTGATAAWAALRLKKNDKVYVFVSAHLSHGQSKAAGRLRGRETRQLIKSVQAVAGNNAIVFMGDFNSYRGTVDDPPRRAMARAGWFDAYDRSATYRNSYLNSFNGWRQKVLPYRNWNGHIDRIFIRGSMGSKGWKVVAKTRGRTYVGTKASDHNLVRTTLYVR